MPQENDLPNKLDLKSLRYCMKCHTLVTEKVSKRTFVCSWCGCTVMRRLHKESVLLKKNMRIIYE